MANTNFIVQNGITVGPLTIDAATGSIVTTGNLSVAGFTANTTQDSITATTLTVTGSFSGNVVNYSNFTTTNKARLLANSIIFGI
jgi:hypothetical protein